MRRTPVLLHLENYRICPPGETFSKVSPFLKRLGITRLARQTGLDDIGIPVWCAFAPNARAIVIAQGKGLNDEAAKTSAAMEAVERSVATQPYCARMSACLGALEAAGEQVDTLDSLLSVKSQSVEPEEIIEWTSAQNLLTGHSLWVPFEAIHLDRTVLKPRYWISSDGLASGNTLEEAILHGLLERIERDALTLWHVTPPAKRYSRRIETKGIVEPDLRDAIERVERAGLEISLFDITSDLGIPCVTALIGPVERTGRRSIRHVDITLGAGASPKPAVAAMRAVTEAVQSRMTFIAGARDDLLPEMFFQTASKDTIQAMDVPATTSLYDLPALETASTRKSLEAVLNRLEAKGIQKLYAVDMTPHWLPVSVVKIFAPQLENPEGERRQQYGNRALSKVLG